MTKVLVSDPIDQRGIDKLSQVAQVDVRTGLPAEELIKIIGDYEALMNPLRHPGDGGADRGRGRA